MNIEKYKRFKKLLDDDNNELSFDFRKILYLNLKHHGTKLVHKTLKKASELYEEKACVELNSLLIYEYLRQYFFDNGVYSCDNNCIDCFFNTIADIKTRDVISLIKKYSLTVYNKIFGYCKVIYHKRENNDFLVILPIRLNYEKYLLKCSVDNSHVRQQLDYHKTVGEIMIIYKKNNDIYNIKLDKGIICNITTLSKNRLIEISSKYLNMNLDRSYTTKRIIDKIIFKCKELNEKTNVIYYQEI